MKVLPPPMPVQLHSPLAGWPSLPLTDLRFIRILCAPKTPKPSTKTLLSGLHRLGHPVAFLVAQAEAEVRVYLSFAGEGEVLRRLLLAQLPGAEVEEEPIPPVPHLPWAAVLFGFPSPRSELTPLLHGLFSPGDGLRWAYVVWAQPLEPNAVARTLQVLADDLRRHKNAFLRRGSVEEDNNPLGAEQLRVLALALRKHRLALTLGGWETTVAFFAADPTTLETGCGLLTAAFNRSASLPQPVHVLPCAHQAQGKPPTTLLPGPDLARFMDLPAEEMPGYQVREVVRFAVALPKVKEGLSLGLVLDRSRPTGQEFRLFPEDLAKHAFATGVTGSGKTETCLGLLNQLWLHYRIPFLVIEPAKQEYRVLRQFPGHKDLRVLTLGTGQEELRLNPFEVEPGIHVQTHLDLLKNLFHATFAGFYAPMPYLLEEALYKVYMERGWDLVTGRSSQPPPHCFPTLSDLCRKVEEVVERAGYDPEVTQNVLSALRVRLNSLRLGAKGRLLDTQASTPLAELLSQPVVLELAPIGDPETVAFIIGLLWLRLYEHHFARGPKALAHVTLVEEAHRLLARTQEFHHPEASNIRAQAVESFSHMLAELRAFGEGLIIVDQSPTKLHPDVLKNTNLKLVHRLLVKEDREAIAGCTNMSATQVRALAVLRTGQAAVFTEGLESPVLLQILAFRKKQG